MYTPKEFKLAKKGILKLQIYLSLLYNPSIDRLCPNFVLMAKAT